MANKATTMIEGQFPISQLQERLREPGLLGQPRSNEALEHASIASTSTRRRKQAQALSRELEIEHPFVSCIEFLTGKIRDSSDRHLRPQARIGIAVQERREIDITDMLIALEYAESELGKVSHCRPSLDAISNTARHFANKAELMVRGLRRLVVSSNTDPAHPSQHSATAIFEAADQLGSQLHEMKLAFEDLPCEVLIKMQYSTH